MIGLSISVFNYELDCYAGDAIDLDKDEKDLYPNPMDNPRNAGFYTNFLRCMVVTTSLLSIFCNFMRYKLKMKWLDMYFEHQNLVAKSGSSDDLIENYNEDMGGVQGMSYA